MHARSLSPQVNPVLGAVSSKRVPALLSELWQTSESDDCLLPEALEMTQTKPCRRRTRKQRAIYTIDEVNKLVDATLHPLAKAHPVFTLLDEVAHAANEQNLKESLIKFAKYSLPQIILHFSSPSLVPWKASEIILRQSVMRTANGDLSVPTFAFFYLCLPCSNALSRTYEQIFFS